MPEHAPRIPRRLKPDFMRLLRQGMPAADAQSLIAFREGLAPVDGQRQPWTLEELVRLEFVAARTKDQEP